MKPKEQISCHVIDADLALLFVKDQRIVLDYSTVMVLLQSMVQTANQMEKALALGLERQSLQ